jgi:hypothetical protein
MSTRKERFDYLYNYNLDRVAKEFIKVQACISVDNRTSYQFAREDYNRFKAVFSTLYYIKTGKDDEQSLEDTINDYAMNVLNHSYLLKFYRELYS